jgi:hypothetical protein
MKCKQSPRINCEIKMVSPYSLHQVIDILRNEIDNEPSLFRCLITLNAHYYVGTAPVCGIVSEAGFEIRNRRGPGFSLKAVGKFESNGTRNDIGTEFMLIFKKPKCPNIINIFSDRYVQDKNIILDFLKQHLKAKVQ